VKFKLLLYKPMKRKIIINYPGCASRTFFVNSDLVVSELLEKVFAWFNHGSGQEAHFFLESKMRSLSKNDCVNIDGQWYQCASIGWNEITDERVDELERLVVAHPLFKEHGAWFCLNDVMWEKYKKI